MAVNLSPPDPVSLRPVAGVDLGCAYAGIRKAQRNDLMLMRLAPGSRVAGVFTQNAFAAAPVQVCRQHLAASESIRALVVNAGNANCGTGAAGLAAARQTCEAAARALGCGAAEVLPFSTGSSSRIFRSRASRRRCPDACRAWPRPAGPRLPPPS